MRLFVCVCVFSAPWQVNCTEIDWLAVRPRHTFHPFWKNHTHTQIYTHTWAGMGRLAWQTHPSNVATATTLALKLNTVFSFRCFFSRFQFLVCCKMKYCCGKTDFHKTEPSAWYLSQIQTWLQGCLLRTFSGSFPFKKCLNILATEMVFRMRSISNKHTMFLITLLLILVLVNFTQYCYEADLKKKVLGGTLRAEGERGTLIQAATQWSSISPQS